MSQNLGAAPVDIENFLLDTEAPEKSQFDSLRS
jgi:hypothetical protein